MKIIKRNGAEADFDLNKIIKAVSKANAACKKEELTQSQINEIAEYVEFKLSKAGRAYSVEEIQDIVENQIMAQGAFEVARRYVKYRYNRSLIRKANTTDNQILSLIECNNEEVKQENSNKNPTVNSVQRDYMAGEVSKDITKRILLPEDIVEAHENGLIHFHDADYFAQHMHNCDLVNLEDMLQNGTVISDTMIEKPHSFSTACNIATQIIAQVASSQYGGQSISLTHLAPFVQISREKIRKQVLEEAEDFGGELTEEKIQKITEKRLRDEVSRGVQTIQYQVVTLLTTNGQAPFVTVFMYLNEARNEQEKKDLALIIEETLKQRIQGVKNEKGVWVTPAFPKLIYVLEDDNIDDDSEYFYLTELAAKCTAKRLVPDYVSEKVMLELKGDVYTPMGCRSFLTPDRFTAAGVGNIARAKNYVEGK
ncbi:MAG: anaerobic ribonucleoside-triphosphate reductase, partial [Eubacteriales bacterium]|nr:anaerobic ribonucleoside-triphosphate reductase [Eubacteriales bacterium]